MFRMSMSGLPLYLPSAEVFSFERRLWTSWSPVLFSMSRISVLGGARSMVRMAEFCTTRSGLTLVDLAMAVYE